MVAEVTPVSIVDNRLEQWSTEKTLSQIRDHLLKVDKKNDTNEKIRKNNADEQLKTNKQSLDNDEKLLRGQKSLQNDLSDKVPSRIGESVAKFIAFDLSGLVAGASKLAFEAGLAVIKAADSIVKPLTDSYALGIRISDESSLREFSKGVLNLAVSAKEYADAMRDNTLAFNQVGDKKFREGAESLKETASSLGISDKTMLGIWSDMLETERHTSGLNNRWNKEWQEKKNTELMTITRLAQIQGTSAELMAEQLKEISKQTEVKKAQMFVGEGSKAEYGAMQAQLSQLSPALLQMFNESLVMPAGMEGATDAMVHLRLVAPEAAKQINEMVLAFKAGTVAFGGSSKMVESITGNLSKSANAQTANWMAMMRQSNKPLDIQNAAIAESTAANAALKQDQLTKSQLADNRNIVERAIREFDTFKEGVAAAAIQGNTKEMLSAYESAAKVAGEANEAAKQEMADLGDLAGPLFAGAANVFAKAADLFEKAVKAFGDVSTGIDTALGVALGSKYTSEKERVEKVDKEKIATTSSMAAEYNKSVNGFGELYNKTKSDLKAATIGSGFWGTSESNKKVISDEVRKLVEQRGIADSKKAEYERAIANSGASQESITKIVEELNRQHKEQTDRLDGLIKSVEDQTGVHIDIAKKGKPTGVADKNRPVPKP